MGAPRQVARPVGAGSLASRGADPVPASHHRFDALGAGTEAAPEASDRDLDEMLVAFGAVPHAAQQVGLGVHGAGTLDQHVEDGPHAFGHDGC